MAPSSSPTKTYSNAYVVIGVEEDRDGFVHDAGVVVYRDRESQADTDIHHHAGSGQRQVEQNAH